MQYLPFIVIGVALVIGGVLAYMSYLAEKKRTEEWARVAEEMGFQFNASPDTGILGRFPGFHLFSQGHSKYVRNLLVGKASGLEVTIFEYRYVVGSGKNRHSSNQTVIAFEFDDPVLPTFSLRPEGIFHKIGQWFGYHDINFDTHPRFSKSFVLRGENEETVRQIFVDHVLEYFEESPGVCTEVNGGRLIYYRASRRVEPAEVRTFME
jgi:hypothetical protein